MDDIGLEVRALPDRCDLRRPSVDEPGPNGAIARANLRRQEACDAALAQHLVGLDVEAWATSTEPAVPAVHRWTGPVPQLRLDRLADSHLASVPAFCLATVGESAGTPLTNVAAVQTALASGDVVALDDALALAPDLGPVADLLVGALQAQVTVRIVVAGSGGAPLSTRRDADVVLLPVDRPLALGLVGPRRSSPGTGADADPVGAPAWSATVDPGNAVLIPRGWGFRAPGPAARSWIELVARRLRGTDVAEFVGGRAGAALAFREDAPHDAAGIDPSPTSVFGSPTALQERFEELDVARLADIAVASWIAQLRPASGAVLFVEPPAAAVATTLAAPAGVVVVDRLPHDVEPPPLGEIDVAAGGYLVRAAPETIVALAEDGDLGELTAAALGKGIVRLARASDIRAPS